MALSNEIISKFLQPQGDLESPILDSTSLLYHKRLKEGESVVPDIVKRLEYFCEVLSDIHSIHESNDDEVDRRITASDVMTLYYLLVNGELQRILDKVIPPERQIDLEEEEMLQIKMEIVEGYLARVRHKNAEKYVSENSNKRVTCGFEVEYSLINDDIFQSVKELLDIFAIYQIDYRQGDDIPSLLIQLRDSLPPRGLGIHKRAVKLFKQIRKEYGSKLSNLDIISGSQLERRKNLFFAPFTMFEGPLQDGLDATARETRFDPSTSYKTQIRELIQAVKTGAIEGDWNIHETLVGITLSPRNIEVMDITLICAAAGWLPEKIFEVLSKPKRGVKYFEQVTIEERYVKVSSLSSHHESGFAYCYFPFHLLKDSSDIQDYKNDRRSEAVERRSLFEYSPHEFSNLVRHLHFTEVACQVIASVQEQNKSPKDFKLTKLWETFKEYWNSILEDYGLGKLETPDYFKGYQTYYHYQVAHSDGVPEIPYTLLLTDLILVSHMYEEDRDIKADTKALIRWFLSEANKILKQ